MQKILITAACPPFLIEALEGKKYEVLYKPSITHQELHQDIVNIIGLVLTTRVKIDKELLDRAVHLKWIGRLGSGMELIDLAYAKQKNIACIATPEGNAQSVGEHAVGMLLCLMNHIATSHAEVKQQQWIRDANRGNEIYDKTIGIIGYGNTGMAFAKCVSGFQPKKILAYDKYKKNFSDKIAIESDCKTLLQEADIISIHLPLTKETQHLVNADFLQQTKKNIYLINTSRGEIVVNQDIVNAIEDNALKGVLLDVLENEKLQTMTKEEQAVFQKLSHSPRVIITPHIAGYTHESYRRMSELLLQKLEAHQLI